MAGPNANTAEGGESVAPVPDFVTLRTEGMQPARYAELVRAIGSFDLQVQPGWDATREQTLYTATEPVWAPLSDLEVFGEAHLYTEGLPVRLRLLLSRNGMHYPSREAAAVAPAYDLFDPAREGALLEAQALIRIVDDPRDVEANLWDLTGGHFLLRSLLRHGYRQSSEALVRNFGPRLQSMTAHYLNDRLNLDPPLPIGFEPDGSKPDPVKAPLPAPETFEPDPQSPYLTRTTIGGQEVTLVTAPAMMGFAGSIELKGTAAMRLWHLLVDIAGFVQSDLADVSFVSVPRQVHPDCYVLGGSSRITDWGITPERFLAVIHELESDPAAAASVEHYKPRIRPFIRRYLNAIGRTIDT